MGDLVPQADSVNQEPSSPGGTPQKDNAESAEPKTGPIKCGKCSQVYGGPSSLKRHLWRIHRMAGDEAKALVDASVSEAANEEPVETEKKPCAEEQGDSDSQSSGGGGGSGSGNSEVKPLLAVSLSSNNPMVRPLLSLSPDPPGFQSNNFGGISPTAPWSHQGPHGGASVPQSGLLPTPGGGQGMMPPQAPVFSSDPAPGSEGSDGEQGGKIKPLMSVGMGGGGDGGIPSLMSLPVMGVTPFMMSGGMGGGYHHHRIRRKDRRSKPYQSKDNSASRQDQEDQNGSQHQDSGMGNDEDALLEDDGGAGYSEGTQTCGECGAQFEDSAALADHELGSHNVAIDLNCDVELTA